MWQHYSSTAVSSTATHICQSSLVRCTRVDMSDEELLSASALARNGNDSTAVTAEQQGQRWQQESGKPAHLLTDPSKGSTLPTSTTSLNCLPVQHH